tara:strand:- start:164 stop:322 length:159 start_codon:yes stop_codon:yes gene_type:complete
VETLGAANVEETNPNRERVESNLVGLNAMIFFLPQAAFGRLKISRFWRIENY